ncbi:hypothetical protein RS81_03509 [Microbacterium terrae]|uniref:Uncharacterized protein n=2 Tax=Microbacterium terrae TaxID=69369 RepID=A0A0M2GVS5_9MICO|nr:hypothetical protein RS81_03509 [Microbacterium terrae]
MANNLPKAAQPHSLAELHFPVGGERFRPSVEDVVEFLIRQCGVDHVSGWEEHIYEGRELWRRMQFRAVVRDLPAEAAEILRSDGWTIAAPDGFSDESSGSETLTKW